MTLRVDWDMHLMEPRKLWRREWAEDIEIPMEMYLRYMDSYKMDIAIVHPTRIFFCDILPGEYDMWAQEFCQKSGGRLIPSLVYDPATRIKFINPIVMETPAEGVEGVVCVHSTRGILGCSPLDAVSSHVTPILNSYMYCATTPRPEGVGYAFLECGDWWVEGLQRSMKKTRRSLHDAFEVSTRGLYVDGRSLFGSDFPHHDHKAPTEADGVRMMSGGSFYETYVRAAPKDR